MNKEWFSTGKLSAAAEIQHILNLVASQYGGGGGVTKHIKLRGGSAYNQQIRDSCKKEKSHTHIYIYNDACCICFSCASGAFSTYAAERHFNTYCTAQRRSPLQNWKKSAAGQTLGWCLPKSHPTTESINQTKSLHQLHMFLARYASTSQAPNFPLRNISTAISPVLPGMLQKTVY